MADEEVKKKDDRRYLANIKSYKGQHGDYQKALMNSINATNEDGSPNQYYNGALIWCDAKTGKNYQVKQLSVRANKKGGFSLTIDLESDFEVTVLA
jgi:hypothetical protein